MTDTPDRPTTDATDPDDVAPRHDATVHDVVVVGAGMAGLYLLYRLLEAGMSAVALEAADDVGGTWYWNRYPGARCDVESLDYSYSWDPELDQEWEWSERYATQPEILRYLEYVADKHDLRRDIRFETRVASATWNDETDRWLIRTGAGDELEARYYVMATGCLSVPKDPDIDGWERFEGAAYFTGRWPHEGVDFTGRRVAVIGTGSSAIQSIPIIAEQAAHLTVFQRTPNYSLPAYNGPMPEEKLARYRSEPAAYREAARWTTFGVPMERPTMGAAAMPEDQRNALFERGWEDGGLFGISSKFTDLLVDPASNELAAEFVRGKIRSIVDDPDTAETLCPTTFPFGTKRPCVDTDYYATFNRGDVRLVDLRETPIETITETGIDIAGADGTESIEVDAIVYAIGFDAMTGPIVGVEIEGRNGVTLKDKWADGPRTYLGLTTVGFPNLFMVTGPGSPSVLSNMAVSIEQHVDWIVDAIVDMRSRGHTTIEPTPLAETSWVQHVDDAAAITLLPLANSWYMGANVPGKPRVFLPYPGGVGTYRRTCDEVVARDYLGFRFDGPAGSSCNDGVVLGLQLDVRLLLDAMDEMGLPPLDSLPPDDARALVAAGAALSPPGPDVGEIVDGTFPGAAGDLAYRLYRPTSPGPHPVICYFHGGGWVLGSHASDDPFCRDLCDRTDSLVVSFDYRHAPEARFPAAVDDAFAALRWADEHSASLGGHPGSLIVAGWSAGATLATVVARLARDAGGPHLDGQVLVTPVTDGSVEHPSMARNAEGYALTRSLMRWFWDHYTDPADRTDPRASPLLADSLADLPPAVVVTAEFDPLRDEGIAYAEALAAAGNDVRRISARGQIHTSLLAVDLIISGAPVREHIASEIVGRLRGVRTG